MPYASHLNHLILTPSSVSVTPAAIFLRVVRAKSRGLPERRGTLTLIKAGKRRIAILINARSGEGDLTNLCGGGGRDRLDGG